MKTDKLFETRLEILLRRFCPRDSVFSPTKYLEYFGVFVSEKLIMACAGVSSKVENHTSNAYSLSLVHNIGSEQGRVFNELLQEPIHRASVFS